MLAAFLAVAGIVTATAGAMWAGSVPIVNAPSAHVTDAPEPSLELLDTMPPDALLDDNATTPAPADPAFPTAGMQTLSPSPTDQTPIYRLVPIGQDTIDILLVGLDARPGEATGGRTR